MIKTNKEKCPIVLIQGQVQHSVNYSRGGMNGGMNVDGETFYVQSIGGISLNAKIGDPCVGWMADHLEPGVTTKNPVEAYNNAYITFSCIGNEATVISGDAKGAKGFVTGKHGGCDHVIIHFKQEDMEKMNIDDKVSIKAWGQGMKLIDYPQILLRSVSPQLIEKMNIIEGDGKLKVGVRKIVPAILMGSGIGTLTSACGDYDITMHDNQMVAEYHLEDLKFGDIVAITDSDARFGRTYRTGAVTIGVIVHSDSFLAGHGPGVSILLSAKTPLIDPFIDEKANLSDFFECSPSR